MEAIGSKNINISHANYNDQIATQPAVKKQVTTTKQEFSAQSNNSILSNVSSISLEKDLNNADCKATKLKLTEYEYAFYSAVDDHGSRR
jgi:hypothetical protein